MDIWSILVNARGLEREGRGGVDRWVCDSETEVGEKYWEDMGHVPGALPLAPYWTLPISKSKEISAAAGNQHRRLPPNKSCWSKKTVRF